MPSFSLLRSLITIFIKIFLQNFEKRNKRNQFLDDLQPLHIYGVYSVQWLSQSDYSINSTKTR